MTIYDSTKMLIEDRHCKAYLPGWPADKRLCFDKLAGKFFIVYGNKEMSWEPCFEEIVDDNWTIEKEA